jgi:hypothetical protein
MMVPTRHPSTVNRRYCHWKQNKEVWKGTSDITVDENFTGVSR